VPGSEPVAIAAKEELGNVAAGEGGIVEVVTEALGGKSEGSEGVDGGARGGLGAATGHEGHSGAEAESDDDDGEIELSAQPAEGGRDVGGFGEAFVVSFTQAGASEIESEDGEAKAPV